MQASTSFIENENGTKSSDGADRPIAFSTRQPEVISATDHECNCTAERVDDVHQIRRSPDVPEMRQDVYHVQSPLVSTPIIENQGNQTQLSDGSDQPIVLSTGQAQEIPSTDHEDNGIAERVDDLHRLSSDELGIRQAVHRVFQIPLTQLPRRYPPISTFDTLHISFSPEMQNALSVLDRQLRSYADRHGILIEDTAESGGNVPGFFFRMTPYAELWLS